MPTLDIIRPCRVCGDHDDLQVDYIQFLKWKSGMYVQEAFPELSADAREFLISGTCSTCFDELFGEDDAD